jgi:tetratricopeptide (TPR) repeat protein
MFSLSFTAPARAARKKGRRQTAAPPSRTQVLLTWVLSVVWLGLMSFGVISIINPVWLQELSRPGINAECLTLKKYGDSALREHDYNRAAGQYVRALEIKPDEVSVRVNLGITYIKAGNTAEGVKYLDQALELDPSPTLRGVIYYNLGELSEAQGKPDEALRYFQQALDFHFRRDAAYHKIARLYLAANRFAEARDALEKKLAAQLDPCLPYRQMLRRSVDRYQRDTVQLPIIEELLGRDVHPEDLARYELDYFQQMREREPELAITHYQLGLAYAKLGDQRAAVDHLQKSLQIRPDNEEAAALLQQLLKNPSKD